MLTLSRAEQEITIRWDAEEKIAHIDTAEPVSLRKLEALATEYPDVYKLVRRDDQYNAARFDVEARYIRFAKPASEAKRELGRRSAAALHGKASNS